MARARACPIHPAMDRPSTQPWRRIAPLIIGWVFFDRLIGVFVLPALDAPSLAAAVVIGGPGLVWASIGWGAGRITDRFGVGRTAGIGLALGAVLAAVSSAAPDASSFAVARTLAACPQVTIVAAVAAGLVGDGSRFGRSVGISFSTTRLAGAVAPAVAILSGALGTWRLALVLDAVIAGGLAVMVWRLRERRVAQRTAAAGRRFVVTRGGVVGGLVAVPALCVTMTVAGLVTAEGSAFSSSALQLAFGVGAALATVASGVLSDSLGAWRVSAVGLALGGVGAVWLAAHGPVAVGLVGLMATSGVVALGLVALPLADAPANRYGVATALPRTLAELIGGGVAAATLVAVGRHAGPEATFGLLAVLIGVFLAGACLIARHARLTT